MDINWAPRKEKKKWGEVKKIGYLGYKGNNCSVSKIWYFEMIPKKLQLLVGCIKIQAFTFILKNTIPYIFSCK